MRDAGVDISVYMSKRPQDIDVPFDVVVTVCDSARESCPVWPGSRVMHVSFDDPPRLAKDARTDDEALPHFRRVRDEISRFVESFVVELLRSLRNCVRAPGSYAAPSLHLTGDDDDRA